MAKHASVYPAPEELEAVQALVSTVEGALKKVSDWMDGLNKPSGTISASDEAGDSAAAEDAAETTYVLLLWSECLYPAGARTVLLHVAPFSQAHPVCS